MAEATSAETRALIAQALRTGKDAERAVARFRSDTRTAMAAFDADVEPLHLPDDDYEREVDASGLRAVLRLANALASSLERATSERTTRP